MPPDTFAIFVNIIGAGIGTGLAVIAVLVGLFRWLRTDTLAERSAGDGAHIRA